MDTAMLIEIFGYIGSALVVVSMLMSSIVKLRVVNTIGSIVSGTYALIVGALPLVLMNGCLIAINVYNLIKLLKTNKSYDFVETNGDDALFTYFVDRYADDIKAHFTSFDKANVAGKKGYVVFCEGAPAGILFGEEKKGVLDVIIDYAAPSYRDCSVGTFLYPKLAARQISKLRFAGHLTDEPVAYMKKMGFVQEDGVYVKNLI